jgi:hypothetical protein
MSAVLILKSSQQLRILPLQIIEKCYKLEAIIVELTTEFVYENI